MNGAALSFAGRATLDGDLLFGKVDFELRKGAWTCLLGPSGVGKSTVLRLIAGLETPVRFDGKIYAEGYDRTAGRVAYMAQSDLLFPWADVTENVLTGARLRGETPDRDRAADIIRRVGLADHAAKRPHELSGGQRQRAALARTLMEDREIILLDEPFSALDAKTRTEMQDLAAELLADRAVLLITHDPGEAARLGARIHVMAKDGLTDFEAPRSPAPRAVNDPEALSLQGALHAHLLEAA